MEFSRESKKPKNISSSKRPETKNRVGKNISVSSWNNPDIKQYIGARKDTILSTEHVRYTKLKKNENEQEKKKEKSSFFKGFFKKKTAAIEKNIEKISYIELDTGTIEIGYDKKKDEVILTFMYDTKREEIHAAKAKNENEKEKEDSDIEHENSVEGKKVITIYGNIRSGSNIKKSGTVTIRCGTNNILESIRKELYSDKKVNGKPRGSKSSQRNNLYLIEKIIPFSDTNYEERKRKEISEEKSKSKTDRSNMHNAMTVLQNVEAAKKYKEMQLAKCIQNASQVAKKYKSGRTNISGYYMEILEKEKDKEKKAKEEQKEREKEKQQEEPIIPDGTAAASAGAAAAAAIDSIVTGIEEAMKSKEKKKIDIFDKFWGKDQDEDSTTDKEVIETDNEKIDNENKEQEDERIDKENPDNEDLDEYGDDENENDDEDEDDDNGNEDDDNEDDDEDDKDEEDEDDEEVEENEFENDGEIEQEESSESNSESEDRNHGQIGLAKNQAGIINKNRKKSKKKNAKKKTLNESRLPTDKNNDESEDGDNKQEDPITDQVDTFDKNANKDRKKPKKRKAKKKTLNESKLPTETNNKDGGILEDEAQGSTQDYETTKNDKDKPGGEEDVK